MDMETSDSEDEDGQISKIEQEDEKLFGKSKKDNVEDDEPITLHDLERCRLTRDMIAKYSMLPWFEDFVKGYPSLVSLDQS